MRASRITIVGVAAALLGLTGARAFAATSDDWATKATAAGAQMVRTDARPDGGTVIGGTLQGRQFAIVVPANWNHQSLIFAHGYSTPDSSVEVAADPVKTDPALGLLGRAYADGFAVGHSAYAKAGIGVEAGAEATLNLEQFLEKLGSTRGYVSGGSMGGGIVMALIEQHPKAFAGALTACGVTDGWEEEIGAVIDIRAVYNVLTAGTPYALPGDQDLQHSALPTKPQAGSAPPTAAFQTGQIIRLASPVLRLFADATKQPEGQAATIIRQVSSVTGFEPDIAAFIFPLATAGLGMDDIRATFGGTPYGNRTKHYAGSALTAAEIRALNEHVQRFDADDAALRYARRWHETTGVFQTPLVAIHNQIDPLVPYSQASGLQAKVSAHGDPKRLTLITVPPMRALIPGAGVEGYVHCGFTAEQMTMAWTALRRQVEPRGKAGD